MNREWISDALNGLDMRHISETAVFVSDAMQEAAERNEQMNKNTSKRVSKRFAAILVAACLIMSLGAVAFAAWSIHAARQQEIRDALHIEESSVASYVEYEIPKEEEAGVAILSSLNDGQFQKTYVNISPVEESELPGSDPELSYRWKIEGSELWGVALPQLPEDISVGPDPDEIVDAVRSYAYDAETKTLTLLCHVDVTLLEKAQPGKDSVQLSLSVWKSDTEIRGFGSASLRISEAELRCFDFGGVRYYDAELDKEVQLVGLELSPVSAVWKMNYEGDAQYHAERNQEMLVEWGAMEDAVCRSAQIVFADGTHFSAGGVAANPYENGTVNCLTGWGEAINIHAVERIVLGDLVLWESK